MPCLPTLSHTYIDTKMTSFQRQLNLYGFRRVIKGEEQGCYFHPQFHRDHPELISDIRRVSHLTEQTHADTVADDDSTHENQEQTTFVSPRVAEMLANTRCRKPTTKKSSYTVKPHIISPRLTPSNNTTTKSAFNFDSVTTHKSATTVQASRSSTRISTHTTPSYTEPDEEEDEEEDLSQADNLSGSCASDNRANSVHPRHTKHNKSIPTQIDTKSPKPRSMSSLSSRFGYQDKAPSTLQHPSATSAAAGQLPFIYQDRRTSSRTTPTAQLDSPLRPSTGTGTGSSITARLNSSSKSSTNQQPLHQPQYKKRDNQAFLDTIYKCVSQDHIHNNPDLIHTQQENKRFRASATSSQYDFSIDEKNAIHASQFYENSDNYDFEDYLKLVVSLPRTPSLGNLFPSSGGGGDNASTTSTATTVPTTIPVGGVSGGGMGVACHSMSQLPVTTTSGAGGERDDESVATSREEATAPTSSRDSVVSIKDCLPTCGQEEEYALSFDEYNEQTNSYDLPINNTNSNYSSTTTTNNTNSTSNSNANTNNNNTNNMSCELDILSDEELKEFIRIMTSPSSGNLDAMTLEGSSYESILPPSSSSASFNRSFVFTM